MKYRLILFFLTLSCVLNIALAQKKTKEKAEKKTEAPANGVNPSSHRGSSPAKNEAIINNLKSEIANYKNENEGLKSQLRKSDVKPFVDTTKHLRDSVNHLKDSVKKHEEIITKRGLGQGGNRDTLVKYKDYNSLKNGKHNIIVITSVVGFIGGVSLTYLLLTFGVLIKIQGRIKQFVNRKRKEESNVIPSLTVSNASNDQENERSYSGGQAILATLPPDGDKFYFELEAVKGNCFLHGKKSYELKPGISIFEVQITKRKRNGSPESAKYGLVKEVDSLKTFCNNIDNILSNVCTVYTRPKDPNNPVYTGNDKGEIEFDRGKWVVVHNKKLTIHFKNEQPHTPYQPPVAQKNCDKKIEVSYYSVDDAKEYDSHFPKRINNLETSSDKPFVLSYYDKEKTASITINIDNAIALVKQDYRNKYVGYYQFDDRDNIGIDNLSVSDIDIKEGKAELDHSGGRWKITTPITIFSVRANRGNKDMDMPNQFQETPQPEPPPQRTSSSKFYFVSPEDGYFMTDGRQSKSKITLFEFETSDEKNATFRLVPEDSTIETFKRVSLDGYKSACDFTNKPGMDTKNVETNEPGTAFYDGANWKVDKKARITFL